MGSTVAFVEYVCEQIAVTGAVRYRKMFGEYMVYVNDKPLLLVCDDIVFVKKAEVLKEILEDAETGAPYEGAKEHYVADVDDRELLVRIVEALEPVTAVPKPRAKAKKKI